MNRDPKGIKGLQRDLVPNILWRKTLKYFPFKKDTVNRQLKNVNIHAPGNLGTFRSNLHLENIVCQ